MPIAVDLLSNGSDGGGQVCAAIGITTSSCGVFHSEDSRPMLAAGRFAEISALVNRFR
jgi:hypothetical protein